MMPISVFEMRSLRTGPNCCPSLSAKIVTRNISIMRYRANTALKRKLAITTSNNGKIGKIVLLPQLWSRTLLREKWLIAIAKTFSGDLSQEKPRDLPAALPGSQTAMQKFTARTGLTGKKMSLSKSRISNNYKRILQKGCFGLLTLARGNSPAQ